MTCFKVFTPCKARLNGLEATAIDVFYESACIVDLLLFTPEVKQHLVDALWTDLLLNIRKWKPDVSEFDKQVVAGAVFHIVRATLAQYYDTHYSETICKYLNQTLENELDAIKDTKINNFFRSVIEHSEALCEWINGYADTNEWLSDQIADTIESPKEKSGEGNFTPSGTTFTKTALLTEKLIDIMGQRLTLANKLKASPDDWRKLFSGVNQQFDMTWLGTEGELRDLFKMLTDKPQYARPKRNFQLILKSHFLDVNGHRFNNLHGAKSIESFQPILDDCTFLLQHLVDNMTAIMKKLVTENQDMLSEMGYFNKLQASKQAGLSIRSKHR